LLIYKRNKNILYKSGEVPYNFTAFILPQNPIATLRRLFEPKTIDIIRQKRATPMESLSKCFM